MRKIWIKIVIGMLGMCTQAQDLQDSLYKAGFENVSIQGGTDSLNVFFEHREFRNPYHSMRYAGLLISNESTNEISDLNFIPVFHNIPIGKYHSENYVYSALTKAEKEFYKSQNKVLKNDRFSLRIHPEVISRFGFYTDPFQTKFNFNLDTRIYLASGLSVETGIAIPIVNNLDNQSLELRPAPSMIHYFNQPWDHNFISLSLGSFYNNRYGIDLEYRHANLNKRWSYGLAGGLTGFYWFNGLNLYSEPMDDIYVTADVEYRLPLENLSVKLTAGQFLYKDKGVRFDLIKQFAAAEIGLFASATNIGTTTGFQFAFSLFPGKIVRTRKFEVRTTEEFRWEYTYNNVDPVAQNFRLGMPRLPDVLRQYNQNFLNTL
ncbi:YjbH domain-containing protein [Gillisia limnaea]|nr:YjbH domain-containing protein [Gillisia limnaea]